MAHDRFTTILQLPSYYLLANTGPGRTAANAISD